MNYLKLSKGIANTVKQYLLKRGMKEVMYEKINDAVDIPGFVQEYVFGIQNLNEPEIELDKKFYARIMEETADSIMEKSIDEWTDDDYQFIRSTNGYDQNLKRRQKVLEYLNYNKHR